MNELDNAALQLTEAYGHLNCDAAVIRFDGDTIAVICTDTKAALALMNRAVAELTTPQGMTRQ